MMRTIIKFGLAAVVTAVVLVWAAAKPEAAQKAGVGSQANCNVASVGGSYAYIGFGTLAPGNALGAPAGPFNTAARLVLDGAGNYTVDQVTSYGGFIVPNEHFEGAYTVDSGCKVTFYVPFGPGGSSVPAVVAYFTGNHRETRAVSVLAGTNVSYLTVAQ